MDGKNLALLHQPLEDALGNAVTMASGVGFCEGSKVAGVLFFVDG